ncbi:hypothetical protein NUW58_g7800 [Xylaria curta]|uniref:Uncharacterized protein n=1 Tax=Xylaria curta TaxID=42375 RepID=A0ACC1NFA3_9PEZI|nr:hypothetical protein NUW58_g7800 [Xylaria curta]
MTRRIISQSIRSGSYVFNARQIRLQSTISQRLSITASPKATQGQVLDELNRHVLKAAEKAHHDAPATNGIAVLASRDFTSWLEDENFMSAFLATLSKPLGTGQANRSSLHVLSGVTDGLSPYRLSSEPRSGFSVLCGPTDRILPGLWGKDSFASTSQDSTACVSFVTNPLVRNTGALEVIVPLANTVFQNGRRSTLHASRWDTSADGSMTLHTRHPKTTQRIAEKGDSVNHTLPIIPLLPLTPPRRIVAGLGNIVRQVEVDGSATPASKELEAIIPKIFEERAQRDPTSSPRPIGVWCWVIPPHLVEAKKFDNLKLFQAGSSQTETEIAMASMELFSELLSSGCRLHKILSGGGGWGLKQGLLSLDPETSFSLPGEDDDMEMFIRSFTERNSTEPTSGLATPGSSLLFCVEPQMTSIEALPSQFLRAKTLAFGVAPNPDDTPSRSSHPDAVEITSGHFGVSSAAGIFLRTIPDFVGICGNNASRDASQGSFTTKVDTPGAYFCV